MDPNYTNVLSPCYEVSKGHTYELLDAMQDVGFIVLESCLVHQPPRLVALLEKLEDTS
jgi:hypothetical protein